MALMSFNLSEVPNLVLAPDGPATLQCIRSEVAKSDKTGGEYISLCVKVTDQDNIQLIYHRLMLPVALGADPDQADVEKNEGRLRRIKQAREAFGLEPNVSSWDTDEFVGCTADAELKTEESEGYDPKNAVRKFL